MMEFLIELVSSPDESMHLIVAHRDSARHLITWLRNLFVQDGFFGEKTPIENDTLLPFLFRADQLKTYDVHSTQDVLFHVSNWKSLRDSLNQVSMSIFSQSCLPI